MCDWQGYEEDLPIFPDGEPTKWGEVHYFKGCPNCRTDEYLMDLK